MHHLTAKQLKQQLEQADDLPVLLDVREPWEFEICSINNSILIPMGQISSQIDKLKPDTEYVVICHHGIRSRSVCLFLERHGFSNVTNLTGGVESWARDVDLNMATY
ncbi:MAG: sulfurtransferase [Gammaproteobacteria bacterium]|nr:sulfurtransferase [Gammaproteobacteria bacterium]